MTRPPGDHGTANQAVEFAIGHSSPAWTQEVEFLKAWQMGDLDEWPEFYAWFDAQPKPLREPA